MPKKRGRRSQYATQRRYASRIISKKAHRDFNKAESINALTKEDIYDALYEKFKIPYISIVRAHEKGEVVSDSRGEGSQQKRGGH